MKWRRYKEGWIVTTSVCNSSVLHDGISARDYVIERAENTLFEVSLACRIEEGDIGVYPRIDPGLLDEEEQEIELQYRNRKIYAVGHGCAVDWDVKDCEVMELRTNTMPCVEVAQMTADTGTGGDAILSLSILSGAHVAPDEIVALLSNFVDGYAEWVESRFESLTGLEAEDVLAGKRIVSRMKMAVVRMREALALLKKDDAVLLAFALANEAMLNQMRRHDEIQGKKREEHGYRWRPFQLAFLLTTLSSAADEDNEYRDTVDLIWFPTGGGKTEAYLGLIAFQIVLRRLRYKDTGGGTTVLMRYTLRLLTRDQFIRATRLICALELLRRHRGDLGSTPISIGMWVGAATSPNSYKNAAELLQKALTQDKVPELVLKACPWCGTTFSAQANFISTSSEFSFRCRNSACDFCFDEHGVLPCNVVDEALYKDPPTMLVATVDKFARLAWEERANAFFGGDCNRPPELIIQDELHLIASALGSVAGLYEAALDTVLQARGVFPKYIASTATIRTADQQVRRLYGREVAVFPPPGLSCDDSYYARTVPLDQRPGRTYIGYLAPLLNRQKCMAPLAAALLLAPAKLFSRSANADALMDAWWTQVVYHGSLHGVGNSHTAFTSDVRDFMRVLSNEHDSRSLAEANGPLESDQRDPGESVRTNPRVAQLTSLQTAVENAEVFARLGRRNDEQGCLDAVLATNMISVGLDVSRLASMIINGQPLTTAEYIQASSRVGRADVPGVVFTNYYRDQARSLSHYESFRAYHEAFYRFVEPTSVTPYTYQARRRALHAALVIVVRHAKTGLLENDKAGCLDSVDDRLAGVVKRLKRRCALAADSQSETTNEHIDFLIEAWQLEVDRCRDSKRVMAYQVGDRNASCDRLLFNHGDALTGLWPTLQSMRNVEDTALLKVF